MFSSDDIKKVSQVISAKKLKRSAPTKQPVTTTISPAYPTPPPLRPSSRNSPMAGPSNRPQINPTSMTPGVPSGVNIKTSDTPPPVETMETVAVKMEEPGYSDEENHPEHVVIPSDPNSIGKGSTLQFFTTRAP